VSSGALPAGLSLDPSTGDLTGTPADVPGTYSFTAHVTDGASQTATKDLTLDLADPLAVSTTSLPDATVGAPYSQTVSGTGGKGPYTWSVVTGSLPPGLTLDTGTGEVSGTPTTAGSFPFTVQATDSASPARTASQALSIVVAPPPLVITTTSLAGGSVGQSYSQTLAATGGTPSYTWSVSAGSLPSGLTLNVSTGVVSGTPSASGTFNFTAEVTDGTQTDTQPLSITVVPGATLTITTASFPQGTVGVTYSATASASGGTGPYTWSLLSGHLPPGLSLDSTTGVVSGKPTKKGTYSFTLRVRDSLGAVVSKAFAIKINR
jgi:hypothetical protein